LARGNQVDICWDLDRREGGNDTVFVEFWVAGDGKVHDVGGFEFNRFAKLGEDDQGSLLPVALGVDTKVVQMIQNVLFPVLLLVAPDG
jgi:hypothetical protein